MRRGPDSEKYWLGDLDSNQDSQIQNLESYRWTISHLSRSSSNRALTRPLQRTQLLF
jgi:hypothetical protein